MNKKGFTLIELMIVVAIIGILAAITIPHFAAHRARPVVEKILNNGGRLTPEEQEYYVKNKKFVDAQVTEKRIASTASALKTTETKIVTVEAPTPTATATPVTTPKATEAVSVITTSSQKPTLVDPKKPIPPIPPVPAL